MSELYVRKNMQPFLQYLLRTLFHWGENELLLNKQNKAYLNLRECKINAVPSTIRMYRSVSFGSVLT